MKVGWFYIEYQTPEDIPIKNAFNNPEWAYGWMKQIEEEEAAHLPVEANSQKSHLIEPFFRWYDLWIGIYIDTKSQAVYICPIPMFGIKINWGNR